MRSMAARMIAPTTSRSAVRYCSRNGSGSPKDCRTAAYRAARALDIPVVGIDMIVPSPTEPDYAIIEANERPGLANHEPQPTAERFIDLLFPHSVATEMRTRQGE